MKVVYKGYETTINVKDGTLTELAKAGSSELDWDEVMRTATKHPDQRLTDDIGIDANKQVINLDLWVYDSGDRGIYIHDRRWM